jgi:hypothetical protein
MMEGSSSGRPKNFRIQTLNFVTIVNFDKFLVIKTLDTDPHMNSPKMLDPKRIETNADPQHCFIYIAIYRTYCILLVFSVC